jgi:hypothetical protein
MSVADSLRNFSNLQEAPDSDSKSSNNTVIKQSQNKSGEIVLPETPNQDYHIISYNSRLKHCASQPATFLTKKSLKKEKKCFKCIYEDCNFASYSKAEVSVHTEQHRLEGETYECINCNLKFVKQETYFKHSQSHFTDSKRLIACEFPGCNKRYTTIYTREVKIDYNFLDSYA